MCIRDRPINQALYIEPEQPEIRRERVAGTLVKLPHFRNLLTILTNKICKGENKKYAPSILPLNTLMVSEFYMKNYIFYVKFVNSGQL